MVIVEYGLTRSKKRIESEFIMTQSVRGNDINGRGNDRDACGNDVEE